MTIRIPEDAFILGNDDESRHQQPPYTLTDSINDNPWADWNYWIGLPLWTPEEASFLYFQHDPHLPKPNGYQDARWWKQVQQALELYGHNSNKSPQEWAKVFMSLPCFSGISHSANASHPFNFMINEVGSNIGTLHLHAGASAVELAQARQEIARLTLEVERLTVSGNGDGAEPLECATCRAESLHSDEWTIDVERAVSFACALMQEGERGSTDYHEAEWKTRRGAIRKRAFEAFRRALPEHLKEADPRKK